MTNKGYISLDFIKLINPTQPDWGTNINNVTITPSGSNTIYSQTASIGANKTFVMSDDVLINSCGYVSCIINILPERWDLASFPFR